LNKGHGPHVCGSSSTGLACGDGFAFQPLGKVAVRGLTEPVAIFSVDPAAKKA
jgi:class 3 adenylate cyclase